MKKKLEIDWREQLKLSLRRGNNRIKIFFLILSLLLWFLIKLSKNGYVSEVEFSLNYPELEEGRVFTQQPPKSIKLRLQGTGFSLIKYAWFNFRSLDIDLSKIEQKASNQYYWLSNGSKNLLESQINNEDTRLLSVSPDTLYFQISSLSKKKLTIQLRLQTAFDSAQYAMYRAPEISPAEIEVWGPSEVLDSLQYIPTKSLRVSEPSDSLSLQAEIDLPDIKYLKSRDLKIDLKLFYSPLTEGRLKIPILSLNVPDSLNLELFPGEAEIQYRCTLKDFKDIRPDEFFIYADYQEIADKPEAQFISLRLEQPPREVLSLNLLTKRVEFILSAR